MINHHLEKISHLLFLQFIQSSSNSIKGSLCDLADIIDNRGKTPPLITYSEYPILDVKTLADNSRLINYNNVQKYVDETTYLTWFRSGHPQKYDSLISTVGSVGSIKMFLKEKGTIAQNVVALRPKIGSGLYLFEVLRSLQQQLKSYDIGSVQPSIKVTQFMKLVIEIPPERDIIEFESRILPLTNKIEFLYNETEILNKLRELLLPKLLSGEIFINN